MRACNRLINVSYRMEIWFESSLYPTDYPMLAHAEIPFSQRLWCVL